MGYKFPSLKEFTSTNYRFESRSNFILESADELPPELVFGRLMRYVTSTSFNSYKNELGKLNESITNISVALPIPSFKKFHSGTYDTNMKLKYLFESFNYIPIEQSFKTLIMCIDDVSFKNFKTDIVSLTESLEMISEKKREGRGGLKNLVGKTVNQELTTEDAITIGNMIASMDGIDKKNYIGVVNYLGSTCSIFHEIKNSYIGTVRRDIKNEDDSKEIEEFKPKRPVEHNDTLKFLVGKSGQERIDNSDATQIGKMIGRMVDTDRRDYVGMVNFLGASCRIHHDILNAYYEASEKKDGVQQGQQGQQGQQVQSPHISPPKTKKPRNVKRFISRMKNDSDYNKKTNRRTRDAMKKKQIQKNTL